MSQINARIPFNSGRASVADTHTAKERERKRERERENGGGERGFGIGNGNLIFPFLCWRALPLFGLLKGDSKAERDEDSLHYFPPSLSLSLSHR
jgi:hypothetical protein